jgi:hypothetical protein
VTAASVRFCETACFGGLDVGVVARGAILLFRRIARRGWVDVSVRSVRMRVVRSA